MRRESRLGGRRAGAGAAAGFVVAVILAGIAFVSRPALAGGPATPAGSASAEDFVSRLVGDWWCRIRDWNEAGELTWEGRQLRSFDRPLGRSFLRESAYILRDSGQVVLGGIHIAGFDAESGVFEQSGFWPGIPGRSFVMAGVFDAARRSIGGTIEVRGPDGSLQRDRAEIAWLSPSSHVYRVYRARPGGGEYLQSELTYTRVGAVPAGDEDGPPELVEEWADASAHTHLSSLRATAEGTSALLTRATGDFSRSWLLRSTCTSEGCGAPEAIDLPGVAGAAGAAMLSDGSLLFTAPDPTGAPAAPDRWNLWHAAADGSPARALPFPVNSPFSECCATTAGAGFLFASDRAGTWDLYEAQRGDDGGFSVRRLAAVNSEPPQPAAPGYFGEWPSFVDPAGRFLLMSSIRPGGAGGDDVYIACASAAGEWGEPRNLGAGVNTDGYEDAAVVAPDGQTLFWSSRGDGITSRVHRVPFDVRRWCG